MKKTFFTILTLSLVTLATFANNQEEALNFFNTYINAANTYNPIVANMYSPNAKIIRQVVKPDGTTQDVFTNTDTYIKQMKIGQAGAKLRHYTNQYSNINITKITDDKYKVSSLRQPKGETYKLKTYMIVQKQNNGNWLIVEEMMQTKEQIFLKYAKK